MLDPLRAPAADQPPVGQERVGRASEAPLRATELGLHREHRLHLSVHPAVEIPPAAPVRDEVQHTVGAERWLVDRLVAAASQLANIPESTRLAPGRAPLRNELADPELGPVPGHLRMVPRGPDQVTTIGAQPWIRDEVMSAHQHDGLARPVCRETDDLVSCLDPFGVGLADAVESTPVGGELEVGVPKSARAVRLRADGCGPASDPLPVHALVFEVRKEDGAAGRSVGAASVLVNQRPGVVAGRRHVGDGTVGRAPHDHAATALHRARLDPVEVLIGYAHLAELDGALHQRLGGDLRLPGSVGCDLLVGHGRRSIPSGARADESCSSRPEGFPVSSGG